MARPIERRRAYIRGATSRLLIGAAFLLAATPAAHAAEGVNWGLAPDGNPLLFPSDDKARIQWWQCPPDEQCRAAAAPAATFAPGDVARGTFFEVDGFVGSRKVQERSPMWLGRVRARTRPIVTGTVRVGQRVRPVGAIWSAGWAGDRSTPALVACRTSCVSLGPDATLTRKHRGWSVYAIDHRTTADGPAPEFKAGPAPKASALVAVSKRYVVRSAS